MSKKAFFFLRHNNDIDHITPVLYKWLESVDVQTNIIITTERKLLNDFRINFLKKYDNVNFFHIEDFFKKKNFSSIKAKFYFRHRYLFDKYYNKINFIKKYIDQIHKKIEKRLFDGVDNGLIVFDWVYDSLFVKHILNTAKKKNFTTVSLPHGDDPFINKMVHNNMLNYDFMKKRSDLDIYDYIVVPNKLVRKRYASIDKNKVKILGSPRFCDEWIKILSDIKPSFDFKEGKGKVKILVFLRSTGYSIFWDEVARTIKMMSQFPEIYLIVKHHPRGNALKKFEDVIDLSNVRHILDEIPSDTLMDWADLIIDLGTSAIWEPIKKGKPVLAADHLHANRSTAAYYIKESEILYRDQLYDFLKEFVKNKNMTFYRSGGRERFIKEMIDVPDKNVLERYCKFLKECLNESKKKRQN